MKLKKSDNVKILSGKDKGKTGLIEKVFPVENKIVVKGIALAKKHVKPSGRKTAGGIIDINLKIDASNASLVCPNCGKTTKIAFKMEDNNKKTRICKKCNQSIENRIK